jgi:hypothetical protein
VVELDPMNAQAHFGLARVAFQGDDGYGYNSVGRLAA